MYLDVHQKLYPYIFSVLHVGITRPNYSYTPRNREVKERFRVTFTANARFTLRISFKERLSVTPRQTQIYTPWPSFPFTYRLQRYTENSNDLFQPQSVNSALQQSLIQPFLEPFEHNLGQKSSIKRLFQPTLGSISALATKLALANWTLSALI